MMLRPIVTLAAMVLFVSDTAAHHSIAAGFEMDETVTVEGSIKSMEWINPHAKLYVEVPGEDGSVETWTAWFSSANRLYRRGWRSTDLPGGAKVTVSGYPARDGSSQLYGAKTRLPDGRMLFDGTAPEDRR